MENVEKVSLPTTVTVVGKKKLVLRWCAVLPDGKELICWSHYPKHSWVEELVAEDKRQRVAFTYTTTGKRHVELLLTSVSRNGQLPLPCFPTERSCRAHR